MISITCRVSLRPRGGRAQRLDRDLGEGEEQQATAVRGHLALMGELLALNGSRLDTMLRQQAAEVQVGVPRLRTHACARSMQPSSGCGAGGGGAAAKALLASLWLCLNF